jgi:hypothetical protein
VKPIDQDCRVFWAGHGCNLDRGHEGDHHCDEGCMVPTPDTHIFGEDADCHCPECTP